MKTYLQRLITLTALFTVLFCTTVFAKGRCGYNGCNRNTDNCHNGTVFCDTHARVYAQKNGIKTCAASGCYDKAKSGSSYCSWHVCKHSRCENRSLTKNGYCSTHKCKYSSCNNCAYYTQGTNKGLCTSHASNNSSKSSYSRKTNTSSKTYTKKKYEMPDCDDYEDYDDFMDEWDGCMPDGSDAEDYWGNW